MKKLMVLAAIATVAISSQAANWRWEISGSSLLYTYGSTAESKTPFSSTTAKAYIFAYADADSQKAVFDQWYNNGNYGVTTLSGGLNDKKVTNGAVPLSDVWEFQTEGSGKKFFFALIDDAGHLFISGTKTASLSEQTAGSKLTFSAQSPSLYDNGAKTAFVSQGWYTKASSDVPEPTSAMLMLLGVAGLALRRRRA